MLTRSSFGCLIAGLLLAGWAQASEPQTPSYVCGRLDDTQKPICRQIIAGAEFDTKAAGVCDNYQNGDDTLECMRIIRGQKFQHSAVDACDRLPYTSDTSPCLRVIAGRTYDPKVVAECDAMADSPTTIACFKKTRDAWAWDSTRRQCTYKAAPDAAPVAKTLAECLPHLKIQYAWISESQDRCAVYSPNGEFMSFVDSRDKCEQSGVECLHRSGVLASTSTALIEGTLYHVVPEILQLPNGAAVPKEAYEKYGADLVAASLVARLHARNEAAANVSEPAYDYKANALIQMRFDAKYIGAIEKSGFLNQHQTGHSNGALDDERRKNIEDSLVHVQIDAGLPGADPASSPGNVVRPKYAFLAFPKDTNGQQRGDLLRDYGNVVAVFKNEVKDRATFTGVDSLNGDMQGGEVVYGRVRAHTFNYRAKEKLAKTADENGTSFWETQIYGHLGIEDVNYFLVDCPGDEAVTEASLEKLKQTGLAIYKCQYVKDHSHLEKGEVIAAPNPALIRHATVPAGSLTSKFAQ